MVLWCERRGFGKLNTTMFRELRFDLMQLGWCGVREVEVVGLDTAMVQVGCWSAMFLIFDVL